MRLFDIRQLKQSRGLTLVELLVSLTIMTVVMAMIVGTWIALQSSEAETVRSDQTRADVRLAMAHMCREIRDVQSQAAGQPLDGEAPIISASANEIDFTTSFNDPGSNKAGQILLTRYYYICNYANGDPTTWCIYRQRDTNQNGVFDTGDRVMEIVSNIVNGTTPSTGSPTPLFQYSYLDGSGALQFGSSPPDPATIQTVQIRIMADVNPGHEPTYMDLVSTVEPLNMRQM
jgi:prepilin-type N-terminal cleavage/methylation domain-containing protein